MKLRAEGAVGGGGTGRKDLLLVISALSCAPVYG